MSIPTAWKPLSLNETRDLTCMHAGAPWPDSMLPELQRLLFIYDNLQEDNLRPVDPATLPRKEARAVMTSGRLSALSRVKPALTHSDDTAVDKFAADLKAKLAKARAKGRSGWENTAKVDQLDLAMELRRHLHQGDPLDVAALAMMLHMRGESTKLPPLSQDLVSAIKNAPAGSSVIEHGGATIFVSRDSDHSAPILGMVPPGSELRAQVIRTANLAGEIELRMCDGSEVPQDLESGMMVDVLYTPAGSEGAAG